MVSAFLLAAAMTCPAPVPPAVQPQPVPVTDAQRALLEQKHQFALSFPAGSVPWATATNDWYDYSKELAHQAVTPEEVEVVGADGHYAVVGKQTGRVYNTFSTDCPSN